MNKKSIMLVLGSTSSGNQDWGYIRDYQKPYSRKDQVSIIQKDHGIIVSEKKCAETILKKVPYNLLTYPALKIWYSRSPNGKKFMQGTKIEDLYALYKFDSFMKGKILEMLRAFENMFLGSVSYHFELEYNSIYTKMSPNMQRKAKKHNVGYIKTSQNKYTIIPLWEQFFSEQSKITMNNEIQFWNSLTKEKLSTNNIHARRFSNSELTYVKNKFKISTFKNQCIMDIINFSSVPTKKWKSDIGISNFDFFLNVIREFRNSASHPGYILNKSVESQNSSTNLNKKFKGKDMNIKTFIQILPYFITQDIIHDFISSIKEKLLFLNNENHISLKHIHRIENILGIYLLDK